MIRAIGIDAAFSNMGLARVEIHPTTRTISPIGVWCLELKLVSTAPESQKTVRKSSDGLRRAQELVREMHSFVRDAQFAFVEIPHGGALSAQAARAMGMAVGIIASCPIPIIEVSPMEVKVAVSGDRKGAQPSKADMIAWAAARWPDANWLRHTHGGKTFKKGDLQNGNEHLADALAAIVAGISTPEFQRVIALNYHATPSTPDSRPAPRRRSFV